MIIDAPRQNRLLRLARSAIAHRLGVGEALELAHDEVLSCPAATFVTLKIEQRLRGCIGNLQPVGPLWRGVRDNALNAAFNDHRFSPLTVPELSRVVIDISVLSEAISLAYDEPGQLEQLLAPGRDGVILEEGRRGATFLPQVWEQLPDAASFLDHLCLKAGLAAQAWRERVLTIRTYQVFSFGEQQ